MLIKSVLVAAVTWGLSSATPLLSPHVIHEKRHAAPIGWSRKDALEPQAVLPVSIALAQENLHRGNDWLMDVSHPESPNYGKHWSAEEVVSAYAPSDETIDAVKGWLASSGIEHERMELSKSRGWLKFMATVDEAERLFQAKYHVYEHQHTGQQHAACEEYSIPGSLKDRIDFVTPTVHFDARLRSRSDETELEKRDGHRGGRGPWGPGDPWNPKRGNWIPYSDIIKQLEDCDQQITPWCLRVLYKFPPGRSQNSQNSYGIVEYTPQAYVPSDLDLFFKNFSTKQVGNRPIFDSIDGGVVQSTNMSFDYNGESDLDLEYAMTLVYPQKVTLYQVGDLVEGASFNNFLEGIDASFCGAYDPNQDGIYPDTAPGGYKGRDCGKYAATKVISTSYGYNELDLTPAYEQRQCNEYMKLGQMGVSVLFSSGDYGVAGNGGQCINSTGGYQNGTLGGRFNPAFPSTCPYVTSVGATQVKPGTNILQSRTQPEMACETVIYSGGGFSNVFPMPPYQSSAVKTYFSQHKPTYSSAQYNTSQQTRGYPDISANGANYVVYVDGNWTLVYGTSASSPTLGSILTLINEERLNAGKSSIGFINPTAYAHPEVFNDVTEGNNPGCATQGFSAVAGWDPVTGLGTPNYPKMKQLFLSLP
ncbi:Tripeptidyl-peptidase SED1 [Pseudocercospora fuligena]|uniref:tripeptidyl-peptidase II n=1 Tax=Pseudocercospora fuligena TaxID=685502 RepID=A0A8H6RUE0_9PEZI|nr:Tripeptidyl-peptidase SED1 [Pseudocercospora fuligena]